MKLLIFCMIVLVAGISGNCQTASLIQFAGKVTDSTKKAIDNVNVLLMRPADSLLVKLGITDSSGLFSITGVKAGKYILVFSREGYVRKYLDMDISEGSNLLPAVILEESVKSLQSVIVSARRQLVEHTGDKIIYNVENDPLAFSETAIDLLRKTPMVTVDANGGIQVNGQSSFRIFLNGRETSMFSHNVNEALKGFPGGLVKKIEVITNPSSRYDGEGVGGIINIITKKKVAGYNGTLSAAASTADGSSTINRLLNLKLGKFGLSSYLLTSGYTNQRTRSFEEIVSMKPVAFAKRTSNGQALNTDAWKSGNIELSFEADSFHTLSTYVLLGTRVNKIDETSLLDLVRANLMDTVRSTYTSVVDNNSSYINSGFEYLQKFPGNSAKEFSIRMNSDIAKDNSYSASSQNSPSQSRYIVDDSKATNHEYTIQGDYIQPFQKGSKLEFGVKAIIRRAASDYQNLVKYSAAVNYKLNLPNTDYFTYRHDVYSVYATSQFRVGKLVFRTGLRVERTFLYGDFVSSTTKVDQNYLTFLPNLQVSMKGNKGQTVSFSYAVRMARPYIWNLNPFANNTDSLNVTKGNPDLQPQAFHSLALQYRFTSGQTFVSLGLSNNFSHNRILPHSVFNEVTGVITNSLVNVDRNSQTILNISVNGRFNRRWDINADGWLAYDIIQYDNGSYQQKNNGFSGNGLVNSSYKISTRLSSSASAGYTLLPPTLQVNYRPYIYYAFGFNYKLMKDKLAVTLVARNIFNSEDTMPVNVFGDNTYQQSTSLSYPDRTLKCSLSWSFGKLSETVSKKRGIHNDDLMGKTGKMIPR